MEPEEKEKSAREPARDGKTSKDNPASKTSRRLTVSG
jgi:hypothetical protein